MRTNLESPKVTDLMLLGNLSVLPKELITAAGALSVSTLWSSIASGGAIALTLAAGSEGQLKIVTMETDGGDATLTPAAFHNGTTVTFNDVGDAVLLMYYKSKWGVIANTGATVA